MNITFLIGNGFDLGVGLNSRFSDFFPLYLLKTLEKSNLIKEFADEINSNIPEWSYFEKQLGKYLQKFTYETKQDFITQLRDFELEFMEYLNNQEKLLDFSDTVFISNTMIKGLKSFYGTDILTEYGKNKIEELFGKYKKSSHKYNFINFNYTQVLERCLSYIKGGEIGKHSVDNYSYTDKIGDIIHVHGSLDRGPIMGVNDISQIDNELLSEDKSFQKLIIKPLINKAHKMNNDVKAENIIKNSKIICIYGMSLGETDKCWWSLIINWLNENQDHQLVIFDYDNDYNDRTHIAWIEKEDYIIDKLFSYCDKSVDTETLRDRIHIAVNKQIFQIDLMKTHNEMFDNAIGQLLQAQ